MAKKLSSAYGVTEQSMGSAYRASEKAGTLGRGFGGETTNAPTAKTKITKSSYNPKQYDKVKKQVFGL